jgi:hypothetical protein
MHLSDSSDTVDEAEIILEKSRSCQCLQTGGYQTHDMISITISSDESFTNRLAYYDESINVTEKNVITLPFMNPYHGREMFIHVNFAHGNQMILQNIRFFGNLNRRKGITSSAFNEREPIQTSASKSRNTNMN